MGVTEVRVSCSHGEQSNITRQKYLDRGYEQNSATGHLRLKGIYIRAF